MPFVEKNLDGFLVTFQVSWRLEERPCGPQGWRRYLGREHGVEDRDQPPSPHGFRLRYNFGGISRCAKEVGGCRTAGSWQPRDKLGTGGQQAEGISEQ